MNTTFARSRGFISLGLILLLVISLAVIGGGGWYVAKQSAAPKESAEVATTTQETAQSGAPTPQPQRDERSASFIISAMSGSTPFTATFSVPASLGTKINFGDGATGCSVSNDTQNCFIPNAPATFTHTYTKPGTYIVTVSTLTPARTTATASIVVGSPVGGPSASIDQSSLTTDLPGPTITGTANLVSSVYVDIWASTPTRAASATEILGGTVPVTNGKWSFTVSEQFAMYQSSVGSGTYTVKVYSARGGTLLAQGSLVVH